MGAVVTRNAASTDPVRLFRFSALTYNGHRIHYDQPARP
jgi:3-methylfumaryl-CoA hydratase